jgi:ABC-type amino acid transport substrate-binding protein
MESVTLKKQNTDDKELATGRLSVPIYKTKKSIEKHMSFGTQNDENDKEVEEVQNQINRAIANVSFGGTKTNKDKKRNQTA